jgi:NADH-quinone oxidoreductase subunit J
VSIPLFVLLALLTVGAALLVVVHRNPVYSALGLVATLFLLAILFIGLDAHLVAVLQIIVYAGAIVVLFLFVIMLLNLQVEQRGVSSGAIGGIAMLGGLVLGGFVLDALRRAPALTLPEVDAGYGGTAPLAHRLFTYYLLPFELTSVLLLVAIVGAVVIGKRRGSAA